jgi:hypothetical protein
MITFLSFSPINSIPTRPTHLTFPIAAKANGSFGPLTLVAKRLLGLVIGPCGETLQGVIQLATLPRRKTKTYGPRPPVGTIEVLESHNQIESTEHRCIKIPCSRISAMWDKVGY